MVAKVFLVLLELSAVCMLCESGTPQQPIGPQLDALLENIDQTTWDSIASLCRQDPQIVSSRLQDVVLSTSNSSVKIEIIKAMLDCNVDGNIAFVTICPYAQKRPELVVDFLHGRMNERAKTTLELILLTAHERQFVVAAMYYSQVADTPDALQFARRLLRKRDSDIRETSAILSLLAVAAFYNDDASAGELIIPFLRHSDAALRMTARQVLTMVPGESVVEELTREATKQVDEFSMEWLEKLLEDREVLFSRKNRQAPGWPPSHKSVKSGGES